MTKQKKVLLAVAVVLLVAVIVIVAVTLNNKTPQQADGSTESQRETENIETENKREGLHFRETDELTVTDRADGDILTIPVDGLRAAETENGGMLFYAPQGLASIEKAVEALSDDTTLVDAYPYWDGRALRIEKSMPDGTVNTYSITETLDENGETVYDLSDCRAYFTDEGGIYGAFKFPYYYLDPQQHFCGLDYGSFGDTFVISVSKSEFLDFYRNSGLYVLKDGSGNDFSLAHTYAATDAGNAYPIRFTFSVNAQGQQVVTVDRGTVEQDSLTTAQ